MYSKFLNRIPRPELLHLLLHCLLPYWLVRPYAHRALFALALRPLPGIKIDAGVPTLNQLNALDQLGIVEGDPLGSFASEAATTTTQELHMRKDFYKKSVISSGETPVLELSLGDVVYESEIVCEFIDASSIAQGTKLIPSAVAAVGRRHGIHIYTYSYPTYFHCFQGNHKQNPTRKQKR